MAVMGKMITVVVVVKLTIRLLQYSDDLMMVQIMNIMFK